MHNGFEVAVIDDDFDQRNVIALLLKSIGLTATLYESAEAFLAAAMDTVACVLTDLRMPGMSGLQLQQELRSRDVRVPLIMLTGHADVPIAVRSMKAGVFDFIEKPCSPQLLLESVQEAVRQSEQLRREQEETRGVRDRFATLTGRERQVMRQVVDGVSNKNIAARLNLSEKTVEFHRAKVMSKMGAESVADLVRQSLVCPKSGMAEYLPSGPVYRELGKTVA